MSNGNIIVTSTVNKVTWVVDESSYKRALKRIKSLKSALRSLLNRWRLHRNAPRRVKAKQH